MDTESGGDVNSSARRRYLAEAKNAQLKEDLKQHQVNRYSVQPLFFFLSLVSACFSMFVFCFLVLLVCVGLLCCGGCLFSLFGTRC